MTNVKTKETTSTLNQHSGSILHLICFQNTTQGVPLINMNHLHCLRLIWLVYNCVTCMYIYTVIFFVKYYKNTIII